MNQRASLGLFGGLLWYLEARNWALEKMRSSPHGSNTFDLRMHHSLFFVNIMSAVDCVADYLKDNNANPKAFMERIKNGFGQGDDYNYLRELRNSVVHRGFDPSAAGHSDGTVVRVLCPAAVEDQNGRTYSCSFRYLDELAQKCREVVDPSVTAVLEGFNLFDPQLHEPDRAETMNAVESSTEMPDWAKALAKQAFDRMDCADAASKVARSRVDKMRKLLA